jgi:hypothetical protein
MKTLVAPLLVAGMIGIGAALGQTPHAHADGDMTYSPETPYVDSGTYDETQNVPDADATLGDFDDNGIQDVEPYDTDQGTWPIDPDGNVF